MAARSLHFCNQAGCNILTSTPYCPAHTQPRAARTDYRGRSDERGYDSRWQRVRERFLMRHPLCSRCQEQGRIVMASVAHHVVPINDGGPRLDQANLRALCRDCHEIIHGRKRDRLEG